jgi:glycerol-3-phosphate dehydrogenase
VGGKWTSFRAFSEHAANIILEHLGIERKISTQDLKIGGAKNYPQDQAAIEEYLSKLEKNCNYGGSQLKRLFETYGTNIESMLHEHGDDICLPLETIPGKNIGEIKHLVTHEDVLHLDDLLLRRTMLGKMGCITPESLWEIAHICGRALNWSQERTEDEIDRFADLLRHRHKMNYNAFLGG